MLAYSIVTLQKSLQVIPTLNFFLSFYHAKLAFLYFLLYRALEYVTDLDERSGMIIFGSILTTFEPSIWAQVFGGSWGSIEN